MSNPKQHHRVPQFILRNFVNDNGQIYYFRKRKSEEGIVLRSPKSIFRQRHIYSEIRAEQAKDASLEKFFSQLESAAATRVLTIISGVRNNNWTSPSGSDIDILIEFMYHQLTRVPEVMEPIVSKVPYASVVEQAKAVVALRGASISPEEEQQVWQRKEINLHNARVKVLKEESQTVLTLMRTCGLTIAHIARSTGGLVIGSHPVVTNASILEGQVADPGFGATLPVAPDVALVFHAVSAKRGVVIVDSVSDVGKFNCSAFNQSREVGSRSRSVLLSLANRCGYAIS